MDNHNFDECIDSVLNNARFLVEKYDIDEEELLKIFSMIASAMMHELGADSVTTKFGEMKLEVIDGQ